MNGGSDAFVVRLNAAGSALDYATFLGGSSDDDGPALALDGAGRATVTGSTSSFNFPTTPGAFDMTFNPGVCGPYVCRDAFVVRLNATGSALDYATFLGGSDWDDGYALGLDAAGRATVTGKTSSSNFPITPDAFDPSFGGDHFSSDAFIAKLAIGAAPMPTNTPTRDSHPHPNGHADTDTYQHAHANPYAYTNRHAHANSHANPHPHADRHADPYANRDPHRHAGRPLG